MLCGCVPFCLCHSVCHLCVALCQRRGCMQACMGQVVELVLEQQVSAVVIAPKWEAQWWWPLLVQGASMVVDLLPLLTGDQLFAQVRSNGRFHPWEVCACAGSHEVGGSILPGIITPGSGASCVAW